MSVHDESIDSGAATHPALRALNRREFLKLAGTGLVVVITSPLPVWSEEEDGTPDFNAFLRIGEDGSALCFTGKIEMGQGIVTSLPQMLAEELFMPVDRITMVMGDTAQCPFDAGTWGSLSTRTFGPVLLQAAAEAREALLSLGARHLQVDREKVRAHEGAVVHVDDPERSVTYGELVQGKRIRREIVSGDVPRTAWDKCRVMGTERRRVDAVAKVTGAAQYAGDIRRPGMLYARILRPPAHDAKLEKLDTSAARGQPDVRVVEEDDLVAVLHPTPDGAQEALELIEATYDVPPSAIDQDSIHAHLRKNAPTGELEDSGGDVARGETLAADVLSATYLDGYVAHASIETHTAVAEEIDGVLTVWASTQSPFGARRAIAGALGRVEDSVRVITPFVGGGFGGKSRGNQVVEAARLATIVGSPVHLEYTRAEEFFYDSFRPAAVVEIRAGLTAAGDVSFWDYAVFFAGSRGAAQFYDFPHHRTVAHSRGWGGAPGTHPFATGPWRAPANNTNTFARESHVDQLAAMAKRDPVEFRLAHLADPRMRRTLEAAAKQFGWEPAPAPSGRGLGIACGIDAGTHVALIVQVEVDRNTGAVQVKRVVCAQDMGLVVNPDGARMQVEGCVTMGLGYALSEELRFEGGKVLDTNFDTYELPRFSWVPSIETVFVDAGDAAPQGGGEPAIICVGGAIANAIHDATGVRLRRMPMTPGRVRAALESE